MTPEDHQVLEINSLREVNRELADLVYTLDQEIKGWRSKYDASQNRALDLDVLLNRERAECSENIRALDREVSDLEHILASTRRKLSTSGS